MAVRKRKQRPQIPLAEFLAQRDTKGGFEKKLISLKAAESAGMDGAQTILRPTEEQLEKINQFTLSPKGPDDVVVLPTWACNDMLDRDEDVFRTATVEEFASLPAPYSPIGKSFMVSHDTRQLPVGRIFDCAAEKVEDTTFLKVFSYIPNTEANKAYIENLDYGVYWAVSVGVLFKEAFCSLGKEQGFEPHGWSGWPWWCEMGHEKGFGYDPESDETDAWGDPLPSDDPKFAKVHRQFDGAKDFYELSQVYLGAQYFAQLADKDPGMKSLMKVASARAVPVVGLSSKEVEIPGLAVPEKLEAALKANTATVNEDGSIKWDEDGLRYIYEAGEVSCLGRLEAAPDGEQEARGDQSETPPGEAGTGEPPVEQDNVDAAAAEVQGEAPAEATTEVESTETPEPPVTSSTETNEEESGEMDQEQLHALARRAGVSAQLIERSTTLTGVSPTEAMIQTLAGDRANLERRAELGDRWIEGLRKDAIDWYVKARQSKLDSKERVNTENFEKLLSRCGDDPELIQSLRDEQKDLARSKFPEAVRRSSFPANANDASQPSESHDFRGKEQDEKVRSIHPS